MAGHSKWHNIQHRKNLQDKKRGKLFTKLIREITIAARTGGPDPETNPRLRAAIDKGRGYNMSSDTIKRAIKRGAGDEDDSHLFEIRYEGYGPAGTAVMVECLTDNKNRTVADVRHAFTKCGGNLGTDGSVAYLFNKVGLITFPISANEERIMEVALEVGAKDIRNNEDGSIDVYTAEDAVLDMKEAFVAAGTQPESAEVTMIPSTYINIDDLDVAEKILRLNDMLEDLDDVQNVYSNADIADAVLAKLG